MSIYGNVFPEQNTCSDSKPTCVQTVIFCVDRNSLLQTGWGGDYIEGFCLWNTSCWTQALIDHSVANLCARVGSRVCGIEQYL